MDVTKIVLATLTLLSAIISTVIVPWVKLKIEETKSKMTEQEQDNLIKWAKIAVDAAEMIYRESGMGEAKKAFVEKYMLDYLTGRGMTYDAEQVNLAIESAVLELKKDINKA